MNEIVGNIGVLSERIESNKEHIQTEEATKTSLVMPFIQMLGYDIFNPSEVIPEFTADVGSKKGEKVDFVVKNDDEIVMLFECKSCGTDLNAVHASQLRRYFHVTNSRIGILTNGILYQFYSDLDDSNKMDEKPFMELDISSVDENILPELSKLTKKNFEIDSMLSTANNLKYISQLKIKISEEFSSPSSDFVRYFATQVYPKKIMPNVLEEFTVLTKKALNNYLNDKINDRLKKSMVDSNYTEDSVVEEEFVDSVEDDNGIVTTEEEIEGFHIVKSILREVVEPKRIIGRDTKSYFGVLIDDNNRKQVCRLRFNAKQKYLGTFDEDKNETKHPIEELDDIYQYAEELKKKAESFKA